ncbi:MAG: potassium channel family protein [Nocardioidaceae bacterium]
MEPALEGSRTRVEALSPAERRRLIARGLFRALTASVLLLVGYSIAPLDRLDGVPVAVSVTVSLLVLLAVTVWQVGAIMRAAYPAIRALEALAITAPLFLLVFATAYFLLAQDDSTSFNDETLTRSDTLYFTVTVFSTVGFGDIVATSQAARRLVTVQMILDLLILGLGIKAFTSAVRRGRRQQGDTAADAATEDPAS